MGVWAYRRVGVLGIFSYLIGRIGPISSIYSYLLYFASYFAACIYRFVFARIRRYATREPSNPSTASTKAQMRNLRHLRIIKVCAHRPPSAAEVCFTIPNLRFGFVFSPSMWCNIFLT